MINSITVTNYLGESIKLELRFPEKSGFLIQDIQGLGPSKANINMTDMSGIDGSLYNSSKVTSRNIIFSIKLLRKPDIETSRQLSYKYFPIKKKVHLLIETDNRTCETYGYVESNEPVIFSSDEHTQISILCPDPYFYSVGTTTTVFAGIAPHFTFPFHNDSLTSNLMKMGEILQVREKTIYYSGDAEIGVMINIHALGPATNLAIFNSLTHEVMRLDSNKLQTLTGSGIITGDDITISTIKGQKTLQLLRNGVYTNILNCLDKNSNWFQISKGDNLFIYTTDTGSNNLQFTIQNKSVYEGV